jgi:hypothetical protein
MEVEEPIRSYGRKNEMSNERRTTGKDIKRNDVRGR